MIKKLLIALSILVFTGILVVYFFGSKVLSKSIKAGVETFVPMVTQTAVTLEDVKLSILSGDGRLSGLYIANPKGFTSENIFALGEIDIDIEPGSLFSDEIVINRIYIREPLISYEKTLKTSNLKELLKNIEESTGSDDETEVEEPGVDDVAKDESTSGKNILIREFVIENPKVFLGVVGLGTTVSIPSIELVNISSSKEKIAAAILSQVTIKLYDSIKSATSNAGGITSDAARDILDAVKSQSDEPLKQVNEGLKNLLGQ